MHKVQNNENFEVIASVTQLNHDLEQTVVNLYNKMKNLESKYIDLANFYKKELVTRK